jgi:hypothetical protein
MRMNSVARLAATVLREDQILGGLCFVCINRIAPGIIRHLAHGRIILGEYRRPADDRTRMIASAFEAAGVPCEVTDALAEMDGTGNEPLAARTIHVHFKRELDADEFARRLGCSITDKTKSIWFPQE